MSSVDSSTTAEEWVQEAQRVAQGIRKRVLELTLDRSEGCYLSQALSQAAGIALARKLNGQQVEGLGTAVSEMMAQHGIGKPLKRLGIQDTYALGASQRHLMREYGIDASALLKEIEVMLEEHFYIKEDELADVRLSDFKSDTQFEAL